MAGNASDAAFQQQKALIELAGRPVVGICHRVDKVHWMVARRRALRVGRRGFGSLGSCSVAGVAVGGDVWDPFGLRVRRL